MIRAAAQPSPRNRSEALALWLSFSPVMRARLEAGTDRSAGPEGCWPWRDSVNEDGYGRFMLGGRSYLAHRAALSLKLGRPLRRREVSRHTCVGNRLCCNPGHVISGSTAQNNRDLVEQGRVARGERGGAVKLTADQVEEIRRLAVDMGYGKYELLGRRYGVTGKEISNICRLKRWGVLERRPQAAAGGAR